MNQRWLVPGARPGAFADAELFPDDGVIGVGLLDPTADELFRQAVGDCDRRVIGLEIGPHACAEVAQREPPGEIGGLRGELHVFAQILGGWHEFSILEDQNRTANLITFSGALAIHSQTWGASSSATIGRMIPGAVSLPWRIRLTRTS